MAFFERIGKKITDAGQNVAQQTKNFADIAQLNSSVSEKEHKISQLYTEIGQAYYEKYKDAADTEMNEQISQITALFAEIKACQEKIKQIRGIGKCPSCEADVPANAAFCNACGEKLTPIETPTVSAPETRSSSDSKNRKVGIIGVAAVAVIVLILLISLFSRRGYKATAKQYVDALLSGDGEEIVSLLPK